MLRFVDPNSAKMIDFGDIVKEKTYPLHEAARRGHIKIMLVLIAAGADVDLQIERRNVDLWDTPLHLAVYHGHLSAVKILVASGASLTIWKHLDGEAVGTAVHVALNAVYHDQTNQNKWQIFKYLVRNGAPLDFSLHGQSARDLSADLGWPIPDQCSSPTATTSTHIEDKGTATFDQSDE